FIFGFLEDSGYIPRLAIFSDRLFRAMGLNGKAVLPMVLGLGCDTMATMTTRILATPKERLIAILLLALGVPCSAQLATIMGILDRIGALDWLTAAARPLVTGVLGLPPKAAEVFVMGFLRRDYGAAGLFLMARDGVLTHVQAVVALTVMTLFVPCVANFLMIVKERGLRIGLAILAVVTTIAVGPGAVVK